MVKVLNPKPVHQAAARTVYSTVRKLGNNRHLTLKKVQDYLVCAYPNTQKELEKIINTIKRAMKFGERIQQRTEIKKSVDKGRIAKGRAQTKRRRYHK